MSLPVSMPVHPAAATPSPAGAGGGGVASASEGSASGSVSPFDAIFQQMSAETEAAQPEAAAPAVNPEQAAIDAIAALMMPAKPDVSVIGEAEAKDKDTADTKSDATGEDTVTPDASLLMALAMPVTTQGTAQAAPKVVEAPVTTTPEEILPDAKAAQPELPLKDATPLKGDAPKADFAGLMGEGADSSGQDGDTGGKSDQSQTPAMTGDAKKASREDAAAALDKTRAAFESPSSSQTAQVQQTADVTTKAVDAPASTASQAFSLQTTGDTPGSYTATGASSAAGSNMSKAAVETMSALSMQISKKIDQGNTRFAIELYPADLGKVEVALHIGRDGRTTAHLTFDSPVTASSFSASEQELRQQLSNAGLSVDKDGLSFSSREGGSGFGSALNQQQQQQQSHAQQAARAMNAARRAADEADLDAALTSAAHSLQSRTSSRLALNLIV